MNILLEGLFLLFGVPVIIIIMVSCWGLVFFGAWELYSKVDKWFEGRKKPEPAKKEQKTLTDLEKELKTLNGNVYNYTIDNFKHTIDTTSQEDQYTCPLCGFKVNWALFFSDEKCPACGSGASLAILEWQHYTKEIASIKKWLKGRNIPTETKDELRRMLNKIV